MPPRGKARTGRELRVEARVEALLDAEDGDVRVGRDARQALRVRSATELKIRLCREMSASFDASPARP